ncbi:Nose resistant to fluoxetine protein 6 [Paragonimus heterotremus]|uniref:Nose resistant to fluoxetine protein 6 n=1 Tax=Paragonimus heterotremus TaxID=100268 RepID=A0A8J4TP59_9TREM|nr:Nose resistant to fluoxetine protein 6 [Paragonimus heterotremus]
MYPQRSELTDAIYCKQHWWVTFLNNFLYQDQVCMAWSWYLSNDFQFTVVLAPIFISLVTWNATAGMLFAILLVMSSILSTFGIAYSNGYYPGLLSPESFDTIYIKPYTRWSTYALGLILGWIIHRGYRLPQRVSFQKKLIFTLMGLSLASVCCISTVYGLADLFSQKVPMWSTGVSALYTAVHRPIFIVGVGIVTYLCANQYASPIRSFLSWSTFRPFARLTYGAYLVHPIVIMFLALGSQSPVLLDNLYLITIFGTVVLISYIVSFLLSLAIESPLINMEKMVFSR